MFMEKGSILVPVDFSRLSTYAIDHASAMARNFGYKIYLLNIISKKLKGTNKEKEAKK